MRTRRPLLLAPILALAIATSPIAAYAQASNKAAAETLLGEGLKAMAAGKLDEACPKIEESLRLFSSINTAYHLADCLERSGRFASAWILFLEVAEKAKVANETAKAKKARERAAMLEGRVSRLTIKVDAPAQGIAVTRDGEAIGSAQWGTAVPLDPGEHKVEATAPGKKPWKTTVMLGKESANETVTVPALEDEAPPPKPAVVAPPIAPTPAPAPIKDEPASTWQRPVGIALAGVGVIGLGLGVVFGLSARSKWKEAEPHCPGNACDDQGYSSWDAARSSARVSTIAFVGGGVALVGGAVLFLTAPSGKETRVSFSADPSSFRLVAIGRF